MKNKNLFLTLFGVAAIIAVLIFANIGNSNKMDEASVVQAGDWMDIKLIDLNNGKEFKISDLIERPILLESFTVWCPICLKQQEEIKKLKLEENDTIISISLDTDPNEDEAIVKRYLERNNFNWRFATSTEEMTRSLIDQFGTEVINAPSAPVILVCPNKSARLLDSGVKSSKELKTAIEKQC